MRFIDLTLGIARVSNIDSMKITGSKPTSLLIKPVIFASFKISSARA
jgi:hypothetical protein